MKRKGSRERKGQIKRCILMQKEGNDPRCNGSDALCGKPVRRILRHVAIRSRVRIFQQRNGKDAAFAE